MDCLKFGSFDPNLSYKNVSAAIGSANHEVGGHGEEQGASCGEKKPCDRAAVDGEVPEHLDQYHFEIWNERQYKDILIIRVSQKNFFLVLHFFLEQSCQMVYKYTTKTFKFKDP